MGSQTEEGGDLTNQKEVEEEEAAVEEVEVGKEEQVFWMMMTISAWILDLLAPAGRKSQQRESYRYFGFLHSVFFIQQTG